MARMFIVGVDVGGTFTDVTAVDEATGRVVVTKVPSEPRNEAAALLAGLAALGIASRDVRRLVHGTTVGTNAVLERRGARVAVLTTAGFRDLIEIGRTKRNIPALFVPTFVRPKPVVERKHRFEVTERLNADGSVLVPLDAASVERALDGALGAGAEAIAVCLLHAYLNPAHERLIADIVKSRAPGLPVSCSADVVPEYREFERFSTTVLNAYLQPLMDEYLESLEERLLATGYGHGGDDVAAVQVKSAELLTGYFDAAYEEAIRFVNGLSEDGMGRVVDENWTPPVTLAVRLVSVISDDLQHAGQAMFVRGIVERG